MKVGAGQYKHWIFVFSVLYFVCAFYFVVCSLFVVLILLFVVFFCLFVCYIFIFFFCAFVWFCLPGSNPLTVFFSSFANLGHCQIPIL